ncbi:18031_t:CDS:2 [Entrophospora sp. SA101]|nr:18031_t:CDS:2 [Entrophospora sp. SA101]
MQAQTTLVLEALNHEFNSINDSFCQRLGYYYKKFEFLELIETQHYEENQTKKVHFY